MKLLHIDSSILDDKSVSRQLSASIVDRLRAADPSGAVVYRDLVADPLAHFTLAGLPAADAGSRAVLDEFLAADIVVIGAPMYNFTLPSQLKAWIDRILVAGETFRYEADGPRGLTGGKRVIVAVSRGGHYDAGLPTEHLEHVETYLRGVFAFIGIAVEVIAADGTNIPADRAPAIDHALADIRALAA